MSRLDPRTDDRSRGFSFPETLLVVSVIGLAVAASVPLINEQVRSARVRAIADEFALSLRAVRMIAVSTRQDSVLAVDLAQNCFEYTDLGGKTRRFPLPIGARIASTTDASITFRPNGSVLGGTQSVVFEALRREVIVETWTFDVNTIGIPSVTHLTVP